MVRASPGPGLKETLLVSAPSSRSAWLRYGSSFVGVALGWLAREALTPALGPTALPFVTFFPVVALVAWYGGLRPGLLSVVLASIVANLSFFEPNGSFYRADPIAFAAFAVATAFILAAIEAMHRARRQLDESRDVLATTLASIGDGVVVTDSTGRISFLNAEAERLTRWTLPEAQGRALSDVFRIVHEKTRQAVENPVEKVLRVGTAVGLANHTVLISKDGTETPIDDSAAPIHRPGDPVLGVVLIFRDVREQRAAAEVNARLAAIVESSGEAIFSKDPGGVVQTWNKAAERIFGHSANEIIGKSVRVLVPPDHAAEEEQILERLRQGQGTVRLQTVRITKDRRRVNVVITTSALRDLHGIVTGASTVVHDITDIVSAQAALAREKELLATTLSSIGDAVIATDIDGRVTFLNPIAVTLTGWRPEEAAGCALPEVFRIVDEESRRPVENPALRVMREGVIVGLANHTLLLSKTGEETPIDDSAAPIRDERSAIVGSVLVFRDVTQRRRAEQALRNAEERFRALVRATARIVWTTDADGRVQDAFPSWSAYTGQTIAERSDLGWLELVHPSDRQQAIALWRQAVAGATQYQVEFRLRTRKGDYRWTIARAVPLLESNGDVRGWVGMNTDIHEERIIQEALRQSEEQMRMSLTAARMVVWDWDLTRNTVESERTDIRQFEVDRGWGIIHPDDLERVRSEITEAISHRDEYVTELRTIRPGTEGVTWLEVMGKIVRNSDGPVRAFGTSRDITERKRFEAALQDADRRKNEFLATLAHELRNPLAPISNALELMNRAEHDHTLKDNARRMMERQVAQLVRLVDDLLDLTRITSNKLTLRKEQVELGLVIQHSIEAVGLRIDAAHQTLSLEGLGEPIYLYADLVRLTQVFTNLLDNACKYSEEGGRIRIVVERHGTDVCVSVKDDGVGIAREHLPRVFDMFSQVGSVTDRRQEGLGIGLALVRALVDLHAGHVDVHSEGLGKGAEFRVQLPVEVASAPIPRSSTVAAPKPSTRHRLVVADDNEDAADSMASLLRLSGHEVEIVRDGLEAVAAVERFRPDAVLLDIGMPGINGFEACQRIRAQPWGRAVVIVALTGFGQDEDRRRTREAGFDHHLVKPVDYRTLIELLTSSLLHERRS